MMKKSEEKTTALIWRRSVWENGLRCTKCGELLFDRLRNETLDIRTKDNSTESGDLYCGKCGYRVGRFSERRAYSKASDDWSEQLRAEALADDKLEADSLRAENGKLRSKIGQLNAEVRDLQSTIYAKNSALKDTIAALDKAREEIERNRREMGKMNTRIADLEDLLDECLYGNIEKQKNR